MICILSIDSDQSTNEVMDWIRFYKKDCRRINAEDIVKDSSLKITINGNVVFNLNGKVVSSEKVNVVWFRKWNNPLFTNQEPELNHEFHRGLTVEYDEISNFLFQTFEKSYWLNSPNDKKNNKLYQLKIANEVGLNTPNSFIINNKNDLLEIKKVQEKIITKPLLANVSIIKDDVPHCSYTCVVDDDFIMSQQNFFFPSLIQEQIDKEFELRCFYINKEIYCMAIFSQSDDQTKIDFRQYNSNKPNRTVPYNVPGEIKRKIVLFMEHLNLECGSLDLIKDLNGNYVFLEVNPLGQFGMVSKPCNFNLEKEIAKFLIQKEDEARMCI